MFKKDLAVGNRFTGEEGLYSIQGSLPFQLGISLFEFRLLPGHFLVRFRALDHCGNVVAIDKIMKRLERVQDNIDSLRWERPFFETEEVEPPAAYFLFEEGNRRVLHTIVGI